MKQTDSNFGSVLSIILSSDNSQTILKPILDLLPKEQVFNAITKENKDTLMNLARQFPQLRTFIESTVLEILQNSPQSANHDHLSEAQKIIAFVFAESSNMPDSRKPGQSETS